MMYNIGDLVGIGWSSVLKRPWPAIVLKIKQSVFSAPVYVVRTLDEDARESWCDSSYLVPWETVK